MAPSTINTRIIKAQSGLSDCHRSSSILLITLPLTFPLITNLGFDPIWFGVICIKLIEIGLVTPPVGVNCYIVSAATNVPLTDVFRGTGMMLLMEVITLIILLLFPVLSTWLPSLMIG
ncbi:MAG: TRAP transporter large permease subunit [Syntrophomonadaceae bacterium]|nr:TRAP transporter large permease subunit [Syntrophomonadaceae bacterium]